MGAKSYFWMLIVVIYGIILQSRACPKECTCEKTRVDCYSRYLQNIPSDIPEYVTSLDLHDNEIREVDAKLLSHLSSLETLSLQKNYLTGLTSMAFVNLPMLKKFHVGNNGIEMIDHNVFANLLSLQDLDLTNNNISEITGKWNISRLQRLFLSYNQITSLEHNSLDGVRNLHYLNLLNNKISYISKSAFDGMSQLFHLVLSGNPIKNVDHIFGDIGTLSYLDVSSCQLRNIPQGLPWALRYLKISDNNLTMIESRDLYDTRYLAVIILDNNHIQAIQDGALLYTPYLTELRISYNKMRWLPQIPKNIEIFTVDNNEIQQLFQYNFAHDSAMKTLSLSRNKIANISAYTFSRLTNLNTLLLDHNDIKYLKNMTFANMRQLITLNLEFNPVQKIELRTFGGLQKLNQLKLANIETIKTVIEGVIFQDIPSLINLDLQGSPSLINDILNRSDLLRSLRNIQYLNLMNGSLETLSMEIKTSLPNLKSLKLSFNPWQCDAALVELRNWINDSPELFGSSILTCASPDHLRGRHIQNVSIDELMTPPSTFTTINVQENIVNKTTTYKDKSESTDEGHKTYVTYISDMSIVVSPTKVMETEKVKEISPLVEQDTTSVSILTTEQLYSLNSDYYITHHASAVTEGIKPLSNMTTASSQLFPSTTIFGSLTQLATQTSTTGVVVSSVKMLSSMPKSTNFSIADTTSCVSSKINSSLSMQLPANCTGEAPSTTRITHNIASTILPTSTIMSNPITKIITKASKLQPTNVTSTTFPDATQLQSQTRKLYQTTATPDTSLPSIYETKTTLSTTKSNYTSSQNTPSISVLASNIITKPEMTPMPQTSLPKETSITSTLLLINTTKMLILPSSNLETSESITVRELPNTDELESREVEKTTLDNQSVLTNSTENLDRKSQGYPAKTFVKTDNRVPTTKLTSIIIIVSISLLALVLGLFIVIVAVRHFKKRKTVLLVEHALEGQTETSDTVFIISHMAGDQSGSLNRGTTREDASSASSKDSSEVQNGSKSTKKSSKFRQRSSASAVTSKTSFNCMRGQKEDDSELLVYS